MKAVKAVVLAWLKQVSVAFDQFCNAFLGGWADETLSARCWRLRHVFGWGIARLVIDGGALMFGDKNHCEASYRSEVLRLQSPPETRNKDIADGQGTG